MPEYVRVKDKGTGHHLTVLKQELDANADAYQELKQNAVDHNGDPLAPEFATTKSGSSKTEGQSAIDTKKEN